MLNTPRPRFGRAVTRLAAAAVLPTLAACQSYNASPLNLGQFNASLSDRLENLEPVREYVVRLHEVGRQAPESFNLADGITLAEAEVLALFYNPTLRIARLEGGVTRASADHAGLWQDPVFGFDGAEILNPSGPFEYGLTLSLTLPISGRLDAEKDRANAEHGAQLRRIEDAEWSTRTSIRDQWALWSAEVEHTNMLREIVEHIKEITSLSNELERAGELSRIEASLFRIELAARTAELSQVRAQADHSSIKLLHLMGVAPGAEVLLIPTLTNAPTHSDATQDTLIERNTRLAIMRAEYQAAEENLRVEIRKQYPDITIGSGYGDEGDDRLLLGVSVPVPIFNANRAGITEAEAHRELARARAEAVLMEQSAALESARLAHTTAIAQRANYENNIVPQLEQQADDIHSLTELGEVNTLLLLEAVSRDHEAKSQLLSLIVAESRAAIAIQHILGPPADSNITNEGGAS